jgi:hypothetical protein
MPPVSQAEGPTYRLMSHPSKHRKTKDFCAYWFACFIMNSNHLLGDMHEDST